MKKTKNIIAIIAIVAVLALNLRTTFDSGSQRYDLKLDFLTAMAAGSGSGSGIGFPIYNDKTLKSKMCSNYYSLYNYCESDYTAVGKNCFEEQETICPSGSSPIGEGGTYSATCYSYGHQWLFYGAGAKCTRCGISVPCNHSWTLMEEDGPYKKYKCITCLFTKTDTIPS